MKHFYITALSLLLTLTTFYSFGSSIVDENKITSFHNSLYGSPLTNQNLDSAESIREIVEFNAEQVAVGNSSLEENLYLLTANCKSVTLTLDVNGNATLNPADLNDNSSGNGTLSFAASQTSFSCADIGSKTITLTVTDSDGSTDCTTTINVQNFTTTGAVNIASSAGNTFCEDAEVTFTATTNNLPSGYNPRYEWFLNGTSQGSASTSTTLNLTSFTSPDDKIKVVVTSSNATCIPSVDKELTYSVNPLQPVSFVISGPSTACEGADVTYTITNPQNVGTSATYKWYKNGEAISGGTSSSVTTSFSASVANNISLEVVSSAPCATPRTPITETKSVTVNPNHTITANGTADQTVCISTALTPITFTLDGGATNATVTGLPSGISKSVSGTTLTIQGNPSASGTFNYNITTTGNSCTVATTSGIITVQGNATINKASGPVTQTLCEGVSITNIVYDIGGSATTAFVSTLPSGISGNYNASTKKFTISGTSAVVGTHEFTVTSDGPCDDPTLTGTINITQKLIPAVTIKSSAATNSPANEICSGDSVTFSVDTKTNQGTTPTYQWLVGTAAVGTGTTYTTNSLTDGQTVSVKMTSSEGCVTSAIVTSNGITTKVNPKLTPSVTIANTTPTTICPNSAVSFTATPTNGGGAPNYQWKVNGASVGGNTTTNNFSPTNLTNGAIVTVVMTSNATCLAATTATSNPITVTVNPTLTPSVSISSNDADNNICTGASVVFTATPTNGGTAPTYQWKVNGNDVGSPSTSPTLTRTISANDVVSVVMTSNYPCLSSTTATSPTPIANKVFTALAATTITGPSGICPTNGTVKFSVPVSEDSNVLTYNWVVPSGFNIQSGQNTREITVAFTNPAVGDRTVSLIRSNPCTNSISTSFTTTISDYASVDAGPDQYVCVGTPSVQLAGALGGAAAGGGNNKWDWTIPNGTSFGGGEKGKLDAILDISNATAGSSYTVTITTNSNVAGCSTKSDTMTIYVQTNPTATLTPQTNSACSGSSVSLDLSGTPNTTVIYKVGTGANQTVNLNASGTATIITGTLTNSTSAPTTTTVSLLSISYTNTTACTRTLNQNVPITVNPDAFITTPANNNQTVCKDVSIASISFPLSGGATGASVNGLPAGLSGAKSGNNFVITGTPTAIGTFNYTVQTSGICAQKTATGTITVNPDQIISEGTNQNQEVCIGTNITNMVYDLSGGATGASVTGLPTGVTGNYNAGKFTISGQPSQSGVFNFTVNTTGGCKTTSKTGQLTIKSNSTITPPSNKDQIVCIDTNIADMSFALGNYTTNANTSGLPTGVTGSLSGTTYKLSGTPTQTGVFDYVITATGDCQSVTTTGKITVNPDATLTSPTNKDQILCIGQAAQEISFTVGGTFTNVQVSGLPNNITGSLSGSTFKINGSSSTPGIYNYTVTASGNCKSAIINGTITIKEDDTITRTSATSTSEQTVCIDSPIVNITYTLGGNTVTNANVTGLPSGVTASLSGLQLTISGTPSESGIFNYTVTTVGECSSVSSTGKITVKKAVQIGTQPLSNAVCLTEPVSFSVAATGDDLIFEWYKDGDKINDGSGFSDATTNTLNIAQTTLNNAGNYYAIVKSANCTEKQSDTVSLIVNKDIEITQQPVTVTQCIDGSANFTVEATGSIDTYEWYKNGSLFSGTTNKTESGGTSTITLDIANVTTSDAGEYYVKIIGFDGSCPDISSSKVQLVVNPNSTISLTSAVDTDKQVKCIDTAISPIEYTTTGATGASLTAGAFPTGVNGVFANGKYTITGTPTVAGTFNYTITTSSNCATVWLSGSITVTPKNTISLDSASGTDNQILCVNSELTDIKYLTTGATGATFTGLPAGISGSWSNNVVTISGTPTAAGGLTTYEVTLTGGCSAVKASGTIKVNPNNTISLSSAAGTNGQSVCINTALTNITYATTSATGATFTGLPAGVTGSWSNNVVTISGTPTVAGGPTTYEVTLTGGCSVVKVTGTIQARPNNTISLSSATGTDAQSVCINTALTNITYTTTGATGATFTGLPAGVSGSWSNNVVTISGTPTTAGGPTTYEVTLTGGCSVVKGTGTIQVRPNNTISLSSAAVTNAQSVCIGTALTNITYATTGATGATFTGLPAGVSGSWSNNVVTISGIPTTAGGPTTYEVTLTGGCSVVKATGTIQVRPNNTLSLSSAAVTNAQSVCIGTALTNITYATTGATGATFTGLPAGVSGSWSNNVVTISGTPTTAGGPTTYEVTLTGGCSVVKATGTIKVDSRPIGGKLAFGNSKIFLICENPVEGSYTTDLTLSGKTGTIVKWEYRSNLSNTWIPIRNTDNSFFTEEILPKESFKGLNITASTIFRVEIKNGVCASVFSDTGIISVIPSNIKPSPVTVSKPVICLGENVTLSSETGYGETFGKFEGGAFDNSSITNQGWRIADKNGNDYNFESSADNTTPDKWLRTNPHDFKTADITSPYTVRDKRWDTSFDTAGNKGFAIVSGNNSSTLETAVFSLSGLDQAILTFDQAFNLTPGASIIVEISTNGGNTYGTEPILYQNSGSVSSGNYDHFGSGTVNVNQMTIDLGDYLGYPNLRIRFKYIGTRIGDVWTLDNIKVPEGPRDIAQEWNDTTDPQNPIFIGRSNTETWTPTKIGWNTFKITTLIILDSAGNACTSVQNSEEIRVFAFDTYITTATSKIPPGCGVTKAQLSATVTGKKLGTITTYPTPDGYIGQWKIEGPAGYTISNTDPNSTLTAINNPNINFSATDFGAYKFTWELIPTTKNTSNQLITNPGCAPTYTPANLNVSDCPRLDWLGDNDHVVFGDKFNLPNNFSFELWVKPGGLTAARTANEILFAKHDNGTNTGYALELTNNEPVFKMYNGTTGQSIRPAVSLLTLGQGKQRWYHLAVTYNGSDVKMYVDGVQIATGNATKGVSNTADFILGANSDGFGYAQNFYKGFMDEFKVWNVALTELQIREMMNQEIIDNGGVTGKVTKQKISGGLDWSNLLGYYHMNVLNWDHTPDCTTNPTQGTDVVSGYLQDNSGKGNQGRLRLIETSQEETAPIPYTTIADGDWSSPGTWTYGTVWDQPNSKLQISTTASVDIDWNIVATCHDVNAYSKIPSRSGLESEINYVVLGLLVLDGELTVDDAGPAENEKDPGLGFWVTHYLKVDGSIDLVGESQLIQKAYYENQDNHPTLGNDSELDKTSGGYIEIDQQGQLNMYNYNYFSTPVSITNTNANNVPYNVGSVLFDGSTTTSPVPINWTTTSYDTGRAIPISNSARWVYSFPNQLANTYVQWVPIGSTGSESPGIGFTLKGSGVGQTVGQPITGTQNYVFKGKPNNANISLSILGGNQTMVGNPYPSAISVDDFIDDNINAIDGDLYFWEHFSTNKTHILRDYEGGYAVRNKTGGLPPYIAVVSADGYYISGIGALSKIPGDYIPVGQGFFVTSGSSDPTTTFNIIFRNSQRYFERESSGKSTFMRTRNPQQTNNSVNVKRLRIDIELPNKIVRPLLLGFVDNDKATDDYDKGYDARSFDAKAPYDAFWKIDNDNFIIQGVGNFDITKKYPLNIINENDGSFYIKVRSLENFEEEVEVYLYDAVLETYSKINDISHKFNTDGEKLSKDRFYIAFRTDEQALEIPKETIDQVSVNYLNDSHEIMIKTPSDISVKQIYLVNMAGQTVKSWNATNTTISNDIRIPVTNIADGNYIIKLETDKTTFNKKVVIKE